MPPVTRTTEPPRRGGRGARQRILKAAAELFYCEGINATGVELIANKASVSKRTLYQHFPSKSALVEEYLRGLRQAAGEADKMPKASNATPRERLLDSGHLPGRLDRRVVEWTTSHPRSLGNQLAVLFEGAAALSTSLDDAGPWAHARAAAEVLIDQATARPV